MSEPKARGHRSERKARDPGTTRLRLVSWNVHGAMGAPRREQRMAVIARSVAARKADVVLLQEVWRQRDAKVFLELLGRAGYSSVEVPGGGRRPLRSSGLLAFVRRAAGWRADRIQFHEFQAEAGDWKLWQGDGLGDKGALGFTLARGALELAIWNTHLQAAYRAGGYAEVRRTQLVELRDVIGADARPTLLAGDLNTTPDEAALAALAGFSELTAPLRERCACGTSVQEPASLEWLDYLFARSPEGWQIAAEVSLLRSQKPDLPYSDHHGLDAILRITPPAERAALAWLAAARLAAPTTRRELLANAALLLLGR
jgi:endonuclease/exonuclease/phosphatase family metal-dependent hydrolase